jgi:hypothetical protein
MNSLTAHRIVIGGLVVLLALAALKAFASCADGNPVHFRMTSYIKDSNTIPTPVSVVSSGTWNGGNPKCVSTKVPCYVALEFVASASSALLGCGSADCLSVNTVAPSTDVPDPFTVYSANAEGYHQEQGSGKFIVIFSTTPITPPTSP